METIEVNHKRIYPFKSFDDLIQYSNNKKVILVAINARKIINDDPVLRKLINENIGYIDGIGAQVAVKKKTGLKAPKLPGCELWLDLIEKYQHSKSFYLIGASSEVIEATVLKLNKKYPAINILGYRNGYINSEEDKIRLFNDLRQKKPDVVFVAMGSPKQEYFMNECIKEYPALYQGLGGSFDVYIGKKKRPPKFIIDMGLESLSLAITEGIKKPKSKFSRVLKALKMFIYLYTNRI